MTRGSTTTGDLTELEIAAALLRAGERLLRPISSASRYDLVIDNEDGTFTRVQCKTGVLRQGALHFRVCSADARRPLGLTYHGQIDAFAVFCRETTQTFLIPFGTVADRRIMATLRLEPARNGQRDGTRPANEFLVKPDAAEVA